jgi:hypothetical protein
MQRKKTMRNAWHVNLVAGGPCAEIVVSGHLIQAERFHLTMPGTEVPAVGFLQCRSEIVAQRRFRDKIGYRKGALSRGR